MLRSILSGRFPLFAHSPPEENPQSQPPSAKPQSVKQATLVEFHQQKAKAGLFVTKELETAVERVKKNVAAIARSIPNVFLFKSNHLTN